MGPHYQPPAPEMLHQPHRQPPVVTPLPSPGMKQRDACSRPAPVPAVSSSTKAPDLSTTTLPPWRQLEKLSPEANKNLIKEIFPKTDTNILVSKMAILFIVSCLPMSVYADNFTYWA